MPATRRCGSTTLAPAEDPRGRAARRTLARLSAAAVAAYSSYAICRMPLLPLFARDLGADPPLVGLVMAASTLTGVLLKLPAGTLSDVFGRRRLLLAGAVVFAFWPFTYLGVATLTSLALLRVVHGSATAIFGPVASATLSDVAPASKRGTWLSSYATAQGVGQALGPVVAGYLIAGFGFDAAFLAAGVIGVLALGIVGGWRGPAAPAAVRPRWEELRRGLIEIGCDRRILATSGAQAAQFVLNGSLSAFLPLYGREVLGFSAPQLGWLFGVQTLTTLAVRPAVGLLSDRAGRRGVIAAGLALCGGSVLLMGTATSLAQAMAAIVAYAAGVATTTAATAAYITDLSGRARYGAAHGLFGTIYDIGDALGPIAAGVVVAQFGYARLFQGLAAVALSAALAFLAVSRRHGVTVR